MPDKCPWCRAEPTSDSDWRCGSYIEDNHLNQSWTCISNHLAAVAAERDELRQRIAGAPVGKAWLDSDGDVASVEYVHRGGHPFVNPKPVRVRLVVDEEVSHDAG